MDSVRARLDSVAENARNACEVNSRTVDRNISRTVMIGGGDLNRYLKTFDDPIFIQVQNILYGINGCRCNQKFLVAPILTDIGR